MTRQLTICGVPDDVALRLERVSRARGQSVNATVNQILEEALGSEQRLSHLRRYATWSGEDLAEFSEALASQRTVDATHWEAGVLPPSTKRRPVHRKVHVSLPADISERVERKSALAGAPFSTTLAEIVRRGLEREDQARLEEALRLDREANVGFFEARRCGQLPSLGRRSPRARGLIR